MHKVIVTLIYPKHPNVKLLEFNSLDAFVEYIKRLEYRDIDFKISVNIKSFGDRS